MIVISLKLFGPISVIFASVSSKWARSRLAGAGPSAGGKHIRGPDRRRDDRRRVRVAAHVGVCLRSLKEQGSRLVHPAGRSLTLSAASDVSQVLACSVRQGLEPCYDFGMLRGEIMIFVNVGFQVEQFQFA
jgi:hypothetical protein